MKSYGVVKKMGYVEETANNLELLEVWVHKERRMAFEKAGKVSKGWIMRYLLS